MTRIFCVFIFLFALPACELDTPTGNNPAPHNATGQASTSAAETPDTTPPDLVLNRAPSAVSAATSAVFEFASTDPGAKFECSVDGFEYEWCVSPKTYVNLADGNHRVVIKARDRAGNASDLREHRWLVHTQALTVTINTQIPAFTNARNYSIAFSRNFPAVPITGFECKFGALDYAPCVSPYVANNLPEGDKSLQVRIRDANGAVTAPATVQWKIDLSPPLIAINSGPSATIETPAQEAVAEFTFQAQDVGGSQIKTLICRLDAGAAVPCTTAASYYLITYDAVTHFFTITATDNAGNVAVATRSFYYFYNPPPPPYDGGGGGE